MIDIQNLTFTYPGSEKAALVDLTVKIPSGQLCLVMGPSGSGKSTLLRCINGLVPHFSGGTLTGRIRVDGLDPVSLSPREMSRTVGFVFQDPEAQFVVDRVEDEVAFSLENAAMPVSDMEQRVEDALRLLELTTMRTRPLDTLSGGERQRVAIAAALALRPQILVLDEPTSQLDPHGADEVLQSLMRLNQELGLTVLLAEHRLERVLPYAGQVIYLSAGVPGGLSGAPRDVMAVVPLAPPVVALGKHLGWQPLPLTVEEARESADQSLPRFTTPQSEPVALQPDRPETSKPAFIHAQAVAVDIDHTSILREVDLDLYPGEIVVLIGRNGAGKTTLLRALIGLVPVREGSITVGGLDNKGRSVADICQQVGYLPQDPNALLFSDTVMEELQVTLRNHALVSSDSIIDPYQMLEQLGLTDKAQDYPRDLSAGERQRVAMGAVMVTRPGALLLDEPTRGLDYAAKQILASLLERWRDEGMGILLVTHDVELAAQVADRVVVIDDGRITQDGSPWKVLSSSETFSPQVARVYPGRGWLTLKDALGGLNGSQH